MRTREELDAEVQDCNEFVPEEASIDLGQPIELSVMMLLDGTDRAFFVATDIRSIENPQAGTSGTLNQLGFNPNVAAAAEVLSHRGPVALHAEVQFRELRGIELWHAGRRRRARSRGGICGAVEGCRACQSTSALRATVDKPS